MLRAFVGTIDELGLRTLTPEQEDGGRCRRDVGGRIGAIWAVVDSANLTEIQEALAQGQRRRALQLLSANARSLGSVLE